MIDESNSPATTSAPSATDIPRYATLIQQRKLQLKKSLAAKAKRGGKVASMVQKLQNHHAVEDGESAYTLEEEFEDLSPPPPPPLVLSPPPPPPLPEPLAAEQTETVETEKSAPRPSAETLTAEPKDLELNVQSCLASKEQDVDANSEAASDMHLSTSPAASSHSTYSALSSVPNNSMARNALPLEGLEAEDTKKLRSEKNDLHAKLQAYEADFVATHGREVATFQDLEPVAQLYRRYLAVKKEVARRSKKNISTKPTTNPRSPNRHHSGDASMFSPLDIVTEARPEQEKTAEEGDDPDIERIASHDDSEDSCVLQTDEYIAVEPTKKTAAVSISSNPDGQAMQGDSHADVVVSAVAAILGRDKRHEVDDPGHIIQIPEEEDDDSSASGPGRIISSSVAQPFDEISPGDEIMSTPERLNKANSRKKGSPIGVASLSAEESPQRPGIPETESPPQILSAISSASSAILHQLHQLEASSPARPVSLRSSSRAVPMVSSWPACLDDGSIQSAQFTESTCSGSADDFDNDTYFTPAIVRIHQTATRSKSTPQSKQHRSIADLFTCEPRDEDIGSIDSGGGPLEVCKPDVCKAPASGSKSNPYTSKPMPIGEANSFITSINEKKTDQRENAYTSKAMSIDEVNSFIVTEKKTIHKEEEQMTDITFPSIQEEETWSNMVDEMMKTLEEDVALAKKTTTSQNPDTSDNIASDHLQADASASKLALVMEELDSLKVEFDGISKKLTISNDHLKELERRVEERDQTIATLELERDLALADVKHLNHNLRRLEDETEEANAITRRTMKKKDAMIALLQNTTEKLIEKLKQAPNAAKEKVTKSNDYYHVLPTITSSRSNAESPLHPDDELDDDLHNNNNNNSYNKGLGETSQNQLTELSLLSLPLKANQKSRAIDICRRNNKQISISSNEEELSQSSLMVEEALAFVRGLREGRGF